MRYIFSFLLVLITWVLIGQRFDDVVVTSTEVTKNIYMLEGAGGNIGLFVGEDGLIMIDDQYAELSGRIQAKIQSISDHPVKYLINTHWHGDHSGGNETFSQGGAIIIAHQNVRERLSTDQIMKAFDREVKASPKAAWPTITFTEDMMVHINGQDVMLLHVHNAHTDGDTFVWFPEANVLHMGDCFFSGRFPFIDLGSGGTVDGAIKATQTALMLADNSTKIIPGHGPISNKFDLLKYYTMLVTVKDRISGAIDEGKSIEEIKSANLLADYAEWGTGFISAERIVDIVWTDLTRSE